MSGRRVRSTKASWRRRTSKYRRLSDVTLDVSKGFPTRERLPILVVQGEYAAHVPSTCHRR